MSFTIYRVKCTRFTRFFLCPKCQFVIFPITNHPVFCKVVRVLMIVIMLWNFVMAKKKFWGRFKSNSKLKSFRMITFEWMFSVRNLARNLILEQTFQMSIGTGFESSLFLLSILNFYIRESKAKIANSSFITLESLWSFY